MKIKKLFARFKFSDKIQQKAFSNLLRFAAVILAFAIVSRGTQSAFMPSVTLCAPTREDLEDIIEAAGFISLAQGLPFTVPSGILIEGVSAQAGKDIKAGDAIATVNAESAEAVYKAAKAQLGLLQTQFKQQSKGDIADDYSVKQAQAKLDEAYKNYNNAQTEDERKAALQAAQNAENARNAALHSYTQASQQINKANELSKASAMVTLAEIDQIKARLESIDKIIKQGYKICAEKDGVITELRLTAGEKSSDVGGFVTDAQGLCVFSFTLNSEQAKSITSGSEITVLQESIKDKAIINSISSPDENGKITAAANLQSSSFKVGTATAKIYLSKNSYDLCLPQEAVYTDLQGGFVFVLEQQTGVLGVQNVARRVYVTIQKQTKSTAAVTGAIDGKSKIILSSSRILQDGARVKVTQ